MESAKGRDEGDIFSELIRLDFGVSPEPIREITQLEPASLVMQSGAI